MIQFTITPAMEETLRRNNIKPEDYKPAYGGESAGLDLYNASDKTFTINPASSSGPISASLETLTVKIPTGIKVALPPYHVGLVLERGSITKTGLKVRAGVLDPGYTGELFVNCVNISDKPETIGWYSKLPFQLIVVPCITQFCFIDTETYESTTRYAQRKEGCIGSSDRLAFSTGF